MIFRAVDAADWRSDLWRADVFSRRPQRMFNLMKAVGGPWSAQMTVIRINRSHSSWLQKLSIRPSRNGSSKMIEQYFLHLPKIELNRRGLARPGWAVWGPA
jgi:hypothetical protein